jgi:signal transduction histidine kinase
VLASDPVGRDGGSVGSRARFSYLFPWIELTLGLLGALAILLGPQSPGSVEGQLEEAAFLALLSLGLGLFVVRLDRGYINLRMIAIQAAAMLLGPPLAGLVGLIAGLSWVRNGPRGHRYAGLGATVFRTSGAAAMRVAIGSGSIPRTVIGLILVAISMTLANWLVNLIEHAVLTDEPIRKTIRATFSRSFLAAFIYFALAAILIYSVMDGSPRGYLLAVVVALLSVTLTETLAERRSRTALEAQVADSQRHLGYSRALEGVVHSLRHQIAISKGYVEDVLEMRVGARARGRAMGAKASTDIALGMLDRLSASASPRVEIARDPVNLTQVAIGAAEMVRGLAAGQRTKVEMKGLVKPVLVNGDPAMLREVATELVINALEAVGHGGSVKLSTGTRRGGWASLSVADTGPGISEKQRDHLFEPHYTTKPSGTGMGLFTAFGVVREHGGQLIYEGTSKPGAVFTVLIPVATSSAKSAEPVAESGDGLNPVRIA